MKMKGKPVFKNVTEGRIQIIRQGIPVWLNVGDTVVGERYRAFLSLGLKEVGRDGLPKKKEKVAVVAAAIDDDKPEESPIKVRKMDLTDTVMVVDSVKVGSTTASSLLPDAPAEEPPAPPEEPVEEPVEEEGLTSHGDALKAEILAELDAEYELAIHLDEDGDDAPIIILEDDEEEEEEVVVTHPNVCEECGRGFASKRGLKSHMRAHKK
jgi:hypothetical protein